ncbi:hypothetical protein GC167_03715 [bacterium]|nr:hypothetical protein [bacterium]
MKTPKVRPISREAESNDPLPPAAAPLKAHELIDLYDLLDYYSVHEKNGGGSWDFSPDEKRRFDVLPN